MNLFRRIGHAFRDDGFAIGAVEIRALDVTIVQVRHAHIGPVDMAGLGVHNDTVRMGTVRQDDPFAGTVRIHRQHAVAAEIENEQLADAVRRTEQFGCFRFNLVPRCHLVLSDLNGV